jgi:triacylglycerol lipase
MAGSNGSPRHKRFHIVLIPGFGGFDALGQVEYYAGVTPVFQKWKAGRPDIVLHYFDNFPTAAVVTRATRLRSYLAKRIARGEIAPGDEVSLVGHSTGGLDIRCLISELSGGGEGAELHGRAKPFHVDGGSAVHRRDLLEFIHRVVFLAVPQWGTNIADWARAHTVSREIVVAEMRAAVAGAQVFLLDRIEEQLAGGAASLTGAELLLAVQDALGEANECNGDRSAIRTAEAHEAASELALYLRQMASDFRALDDLTSEGPPGGPLSPAHFNDDERMKELAVWDKRRIKTLSFATLGGRPFRFPEGRPAPVWDLVKLWTYPEVAKDPGLSEGTDVAYRLCYRACAGGPFRQPTLSGRVTRRLGHSPRRRPIELWDNDGIVNTASMLWPRGENVLVAGDHLDIVGHYHLVKAEPGGGRKYQSYDALKSMPQFTAEMFSEIWMEIFDFCSARKETRRQARAGPEQQAAVAAASG